VGGGGGCGGGVHLDPHDYHEMLKRDDAVVIDVRNHYEAAIGRFEGQMMGEGANGGGDDDDLNAKGGGARYIDPRMRKSTDFTSWLTEPETKEKLEGKTVLMFCTGECIRRIFDFIFLNL
jgi:predicted sulfurtransferase